MWVEDYGMQAMKPSLGVMICRLMKSVTYLSHTNQCGGEILSAVTSKGYKLVSGNSQDHLGSYSDLLGSIPGLSEYYHSSEKYGISDAESSEQN